MPIRVQIELGPPPDLTAVRDAALATLAERVVDDLQRDWYASSQWVYAGIRPRPTYSPASEEWVSRVEDGAVVVENRAVSRRGRGGPYVGYIHLAGTPRSDTILSRVERDGVGAWRDEGAEIFARAVSERLAQWGANG